MSVKRIVYRINRQRSYAESIKKAYSELISRGIDKVSLGRIDIRLNALKDNWSNFSSNDETINLDVADLDASKQKQMMEDPYFTQSLFQSTYEAFLAVSEEMTLLRQKLAESSTTEQSTSTTAEMTAIASWSQASRIPAIDVPAFDGTPSKWLSFKGLFTSVYLSSKHLTQVEKLQHLKLKLVGSAEHLLRDTELLDENLDKAWESVVDYYEDKRILVNSLFDNFFAVKPMAKESAQEIERIYSSVIQVRRNLETLSRPPLDDLLIYITAQKLEAKSMRAWHLSLGSSKEPPTWNQLETFLKTRKSSLQGVERSQSASLGQRDKSHHHHHHRQNSVRTHHVNSSTTDSQNTKCSLCSGNHWLFKCPTYRQKSLKQRDEFVKSKGLCYNCLSAAHHRNQCTSPRRCFKCGAKHNTTLHSTDSFGNTNKQNSVQSKQSTSTPTKTASVNHAYQPISTTPKVLLATARVIITNEQGKAIMVRALLDQGSEISFVSEKLVKFLHLQRKHSTLSLFGVGGQVVSKTKGVAHITMSPHFNNNLKITLQAHILPQVTSAIPAPSSSSIDWPHLKNLQLADCQLADTDEIDLLIGADQYGQLLEGSIMKGPSTAPVAQLTKLGWIISGPCSPDSSHNSVQSYHCSFDQDLHSLLEKFWHQEEIITSTNRLLSSTNQQCEDHFIATHTRDSSGKYVVRLPFKTSIDNLGDSKSTAFYMLNTIQKKLDTNPEFFEAYSKFLDEYEALGHMVQVSPEDAEPLHSFYLPHHGVIRESSATTKLRIVFNGSCRVSNGSPINEILYAGEKLQIDLFDVLIWFRQHKFIFSTDIEKMYRQIKIHPDDWHFQRILWKKNNQLVTYQLTTVTYGLTCAPFLALRSLNQLVQDGGHQYPLAIDVLTKGRYVDDIFGGASTIEEAQKQVDQVNNLCMAGGFPLRKWTSNNLEVLKSIPAEYQASTSSLMIKDETIKALGLSWNPHLDRFSFKLETSSMPKLTKRAVLSKIAQFFDPLGLLSPIFIRFKIFMQELWAIKVNWDEELKLPQSSTWFQLLDSLKGLKNIHIPRWVGTQTNAELEIHGFCDASQLAMAATVFIKTTIDGTVHTSLLCSKSKVAPLKRMTIPRLELSAAVMLVKLIAHCYTVLNVENIPCYLWTDSSIVYTWLNSHPSKWKEFVQNRVCFIQETLPQAQWKHVSGKVNPADCATRGLTATELQHYQLWWNGPSWLEQDPSSWSISLSPSLARDQKLEERRAAVHIVKINSSSEKLFQYFSKFSSFTRLIRVIARIQRIINLFCKRSITPLKDRLSTLDLNHATLTVVRITQRKYYSEEIKALKNTKELPRSSNLIRLSPFIDSDGLLRVTGRLMNSSLPLSAKQPYIIPNDSPLSKLIIHKAHLQTSHGSIQDTLAYIRNSYWIIGGRIPVKSFIHKCVTCLRHRRANAQQLMGQLPASRVNQHRPFANSGVDYAGPFMLKTRKGRSVALYKSWIAVFVCHATSAIHLEIVTDYTTDAFIAAYRRFTSRRGICQTLNSDCGTNFQGADRELKRFFSSSSAELQEFASLIANDGTEWSFNPPAAPHFGGKFEAAVKLMKYHLKRVVGDTRLTYEEMSTVLAQVEAILNSRPLCGLTDDPDDLNVLTPGHFLIGQPLTIIPEPDLKPIHINRLSRWQRLTQMVQNLWKMWSKAYLQRHQVIYKWNKESNAIKEGTLAILMDERYPPAKWLLARVIQLHPGADGRVRVVTLKTQNSTLNRPITKICPLPIEPADNYSLPGSTKAGGKC